MILWLIQALFGVAALVSSIAASVFVVRRDPHAPLLMIYGGAFALIFSFGLQSFQLEMTAAALLLAGAGAILMLPHEHVSGIDEIDVGESTATRRRR